MDLPTQIAGLFEGAKTGILIPILQGIYGLGPLLLVIALAVGICVCIFSRNVGAKVGSVILVVALLYIYPHVPDLINGLAGYTATVADTSAVSAAQDAISSGMQEALDAIE